MIVAVFRCQRAFTKLSLPLFMAFSCALFSCLPAKKGVFQKDPALSASISRNLSEAAVQYRHMMSLLPPGRFPKTYHAAGERFETSGSEWWCSGFYPGTLIYLYQQTADEHLLSEAQRMLTLLEKEQFNTNTHDLGFMMFCSFGNMLQVKPDKTYRQVLVNSAKSLATRFNPAVGCIRSWNSRASDFLVIIDNMMNLELLFWAARETGDSTLRNIAITHANTTMRHHFRSDHSSWHVVNYHPETGAVQQKRTAQGFSDSSAWARGQSWGLYGFTVMYRETKDQRYLDQAERIAKFLLDHPNLPADRIPYWDYNAAGIPNTLRDASAAAIMASALLELSRYAKPAAAKQYFQTAETILRELSSARYKAPAKTNGGFLLLHSVGNMPGRSEIDVPLTYADYYYVEAMRRHQGF